MPTLNWVFEKQPIVSGILTNLVSENNLEADEKGHWKREAGSNLCIHIDLLIKPCYTKKRIL